MDEAFLGLLQKKNFEFITVKEICEVAGVNRSTFYLHYETIDDLLEESLAYIQRKFTFQFVGKQAVIPNIKDCPRSELMWITPEHLGPYLHFIKENRYLYRAVIEHPAIFQSDKIYKKMFEHLFDPILERFSVPADERNYRMFFYLKGISGIIEEWIKNECKDPIEHMILVICNCISPIE